MGADGGINWVVIKNPKLKHMAVDLLRPLGFFEYEMRDEDYEWMRNNEMPPYCLISKYGTDMADEGFIDLREMFEYDSFPDGEFTFREVVEDLMTRPVWELFEITKLEEKIIKTCNYSMWFDLYSSFQHSFCYRNNAYVDLERMKLDANLHRLEILLDMKVSVWIREIKKLVDVKSIYRIETWT